MFVRARDVLFQSIMSRLLHAAGWPFKGHWRGNTRSGWATTGAFATSETFEPSGIRREKNWGGPGLNNFYYNGKGVPVDLLHPTMTNSKGNPRYRELLTSTGLKIVFFWKFWRHLEQSRIKTLPPESHLSTINKISSSRYVVVKILAVSKKHLNIPTSVHFISCIVLLIILRTWGYYENEEKGRAISEPTKSDSWRLKKIRRIINLNHS